MTFLFSDIESSSRRWEGDPAGMAKDLALHDELLREAFEGASGEVFSHTGDGLCAAFAAPAAAYEAAVAGQRALMAATGPAQARCASGCRSMRARSSAGPVTTSVRPSIGPPVCWRWLQAGRCCVPRRRRKRSAATCL